jgi:uncharacterized membrane protein YfcA
LGVTWTLAVIPAAVIATATVSGIFGMGGGMILMGVYALLLPVAAAMVLHGVTQLASNGFRAVLLRRHIYWPAFCWYAVGALASLAVFAWLAIRVDRATLLIVLGGGPVLVAALPTPAWLRIEVPAVAVACGAISTAAQLVAGVSGPLLDIFFVKGKLDRYQVIGTKAVTQSLGHLIKIVYFGALLRVSTDLPVWIYPVAIGCAFAGTRIGTLLLARLTDVQFRRWSSRLIMAIGLVFAARGVADLL